jgi:hypothetical protein
LKLHGAGVKSCREEAAAGLEHWFDEHEVLAAQISTRHQPKSYT